MFFVLFYFERRECEINERCEENEMRVVKKNREGFDVEIEDKTKKKAKEANKRA